jgi:hypothetical protein
MTPSVVSNAGIRTLSLAQSLVSNGGVFFDNEFEIISKEAVGA